MTRRNFLAALAAASAPKLRLASPVSPAEASRAGMGIVSTSFPYSQRPKFAYEFLDYCHKLGARGVQAELQSLDPAYTKRVRALAEALGMYLEVFVSLPRGDVTDFERAVKSAKDAGAVCLRAACLGGRRYETFTSLDDWNRFVADSRTRIALAAPIVEKYRMPLGIENHKDWTADELLALMKDYSSEYFGVCLDTGNNIALLDDPMSVVERLAPYAVTTHVKDMAVEEYAEGFLLAEVPLGQGMLDMKRVTDTIHKSRPRTNLNLEMITRNPLKVRCLTDRYWATFPERKGESLAGGMALVRAHRPQRRLPQLDGLSSAARLQLEEDNVKQCLAYARDQLGPRLNSPAPAL